MKLTPDAKGTDAARRYLTELMQQATGSNQYANYIHHELAGDFAWNMANHLLSSNVVLDDERAALTSNQFAAIRAGAAALEKIGGYAVFGPVLQAMLDSSRATPPQPVAQTERALTDQMLEKLYWTAMDNAADILRYMGEARALLTAAQLASGADHE